MSARLTSRVTTTVLVVLALSSRVVAAQSRAPLPAKRPAGVRVTAGRALDRDGSVRIYVATGTVRVTGWSRDSVAVVGATGGPGQFHVGGTRRGIKLGVWEEGAEDGDVQQPATLDVRVPGGSRVWVKSGYGATIEASGVTGGLDLNIVAGTIRVRGAPRELVAEAMDGSIDIAGAPGYVRARTADGAVTLAGTAEDAQLSTVGGAMRVEAGGILRGRFETVTGDVGFVGRPARGASLTFDTHSGAVDLALPADAGADVDVTTVAGAIDDRLTSAVPRAGRDPRTLGVVVGDGGARITIRSFKGTVRLHRLP